MSSTYEMHRDRREMDNYLKDVERLVEAARYSKVAIDNYIHKEWGIQELQESYDKLKAALEPFKEVPRE